MAAKKTPQQLGVAFQKELEVTVFKKLEVGRPMRWHRFYDTMSAGNFLPSQPGDFLVLYAGRCILIEAKLSTIHRSLASTGALGSLMGPEQAAQQFLWHRAGALALVVFKDHVNSFIEIWPGDYVAEVRRTPRARLDETRCERFHVEHAAERFLRVFQGDF